MPVRVTFCLYLASTCSHQVPGIFPRHPSIASNQRSGMAGFGLSWPVKGEGGRAAQLLHILMCLLMGPGVGLTPVCSSDIIETSHMKPGVSLPICDCLRSERLAGGDNEEKSKYP